MKKRIKPDTNHLRYQSAKNERRKIGNWLARELRLGHVKLLGGAAIHELRDGVTCVRQPCSTCKQPGRAFFATLPGDDGETITTECECAACILRRLKTKETTNG